MLTSRNIQKVAVIEFNYSRKLNALSKVFIDDLMQALSDQQAGNSPRHLRAPGGSSFPPAMTSTNYPADAAIRFRMTIRCARLPA